MSEKYGCFADDCNGEACVFDDDPEDISDCRVAKELQWKGLGRNDCHN